MKRKDRIAVITGAASGIGRTSALEFAREGAQVVVADINAAGAQETMKQVEALGGQALAVETDVASPDSVQHLVQATLQAYGQVHVVSNDAATLVSKTIEDTTVEEWNREIAVNLGGISSRRTSFSSSRRTSFSSTCGRRRDALSTWPRSMGFLWSRCVRVTALRREPSLR